MRFKNLDINLLMAFDTLMESRSVTQSAKQLHLSQPALSAALDRLRTYFVDPLLVQHGKRMMPTALALSMRPAVQAILAQLEELVVSSAAFDPGSSQRTFRIAASDYITSVLLTPLCARLQCLAPRVRLEIHQPGPRSDERFAQGELDLALLPKVFMLPEHPAELLFTERHVVVGWRGNPVFSAPLTEEVFLAQGHVAVAFGSRGVLSFAERQLETLGKSCRFEILVPTFSLIPGMLINTTRLATMHERLARALLPKYDIAIAPMPFAFEPMNEMVQFHQTRAADQGLSWLRGQLQTLAHELSQGEDALTAA